MNRCALCRYAEKRMPHKAMCYSGGRAQYFCVHDGAPEKAFVGFGKEEYKYRLKRRGAPDWCPERGNG